MNFLEKDCLHIHEIIDEREGSVVCSSCGLVLDNFYQQYKTINNLENPPQTQKEIKYAEENFYIKEILFRLHVSDYHNIEIIRLYEKRWKKTYNINKKLLLIYLILEVLTLHQIPISIKDLSEVSGFSSKEIYKMQENYAMEVSLQNSLEKYTKIFGLTYSDFKEMLPILDCLHLTGHNPFTIIGAILFDYVLKKEKEITLDKIANSLGVSKISIQRYYKRHIQNVTISRRS